MLRRGNVQMRILLGALAAGTLGGAYAYRQRKSNLKNTKDQVCELVCDQAEKSKATEQEPQKPASTWLGKILSPEKGKPKDAKSEQQTTSSENPKPKDWQLGLYKMPALKQDGEASSTPQSEIQPSDKPVTEALSKTPDLLGGLFPQKDKTKDSSAKLPAKSAIGNEDKSTEEDPEAHSNKTNVEKRVPGNEPDKNNWLGRLFSKDDKRKEDNSEQTEDGKDSSDVKNKDLESEGSTTPKTDKKNGKDDEGQSITKKWFGGLTHDDDKSKQPQRKSVSSNSEKPIKDKAVSASDNCKFESGEQSTTEPQSNKPNWLGGLSPENGKSRKEDSSNAEDSVPEKKSNWLSGLFSPDKKEDSEKPDDRKESPDSNDGDLNPETPSKKKSNWLGGHLPDDGKSGKEDSEKPEDEPNSNAEEPVPEKKSSWLSGPSSQEDELKKEDSEQTEESGADSSLGSKSEEPDPEKKSSWLSRLFSNDDKSRKEDSDKGDNGKASPGFNPEELERNLSATIKTHKDGASDTTCICIKTEEMKKALQILSAEQVCRCD